MQTKERTTTKYADGRVVVGDWLVTKNYSKTETTGSHSVLSTNVERRTIEKNRRQAPVMGDHRGKRRYGLFGPRSHNAYVDHYDTYVTEEIQERTVTVFADGRSNSYTDWRTVQTLPERKLMT
jgi:hypothetical protein